MTEREERPTLCVVAGPNGAGKTTLADALRRSGPLQGLPVVNPDTIAERLAGGGAGSFERAAVAAGREARRETARHLAERVSFAVETTLAGNTARRTIAAAREAGFRVEVVYVGLDSPVRGRERVSERVQRGGHAVAPADVDRRWRRGLANLPGVLADADRAVVYDNSGRAPARVLTVERGTVRQAADRQPAWLTRAIGSELRTGQDLVGNSSVPPGADTLSPALRQLRDDVVRLERRVGLERAQDDAAEAYRSAERALREGRPAGGPRRVAEGAPEPSALTTARKALAEAGERVQQLGARLAELPGRAALARDVGEGVRALAPEQRVALLRVLSPGQRALVEQTSRGLGKDERGGPGL